MKEWQYTEARDAFFKILAVQPGLLAEGVPNESSGTRLAQAAWAFIDEFHRQHQEKVKD